MNKALKTDFWVGLFVLLGFAALIFVAFQSANLSSLSFTSKYKVSALFDNIGGLKVNSPIKSSGVAVGRITAITLDQQRYQALVQMEIEDKFKFPTDSQARIVTTGLLGDQFISLEHGDEDKTLKNGDRIENTIAAVQLENLINAFMATQAKGKDD